MSDVEVYDVLRVGPLHADGKRHGRMERERHKSPRVGWRRVAPYHAGVDLKLQQSTVTCIEPATNDRNPLVWSSVMYI